MGKQRPPDRWRDPPSDVRITVLQDSGDQRRWRAPPSVRSATARRGLSGLAVAAVVVGVLGVILAATSFGGRAPASREVNFRAHQRGPAGVAAAYERGPAGVAAVHERGPAGVAAAYGYPARCLSVTISSIDPAFARADFNHASLCGRYAGDPTAIFHLVDRAWRPVLEAVSYPCPATGIPIAIQSELGVCAGPTRRRVRSHHP